MVLPVEPSLDRASSDSSLNSMSMRPLMKLESHPSSEHLLQPLPPLQASFHPESESNVNTWCANCHTRDTPLWRRNASGEQLCNACGLFLRVNGKQRPVTLQKGPPASRAGHRRKRPTIARPHDKLTDLDQQDLEAAARSHCQNLLRLMPMPRRMSNPESQLPPSFKGSLLSPPAELPELRLANPQRNAFAYHPPAQPAMTDLNSPKPVHELPPWSRPQDAHNEAAVAKPSIAQLRSGDTSEPPQRTPPAVLPDMHPTLGTPTLRRLAGQMPDTFGRDPAAGICEPAFLSGLNNGVSASAAETAAATTLLAAAAESEEMRSTRSCCQKCAEQLNELRTSQARQLETLAARIHYQIMDIASALSREQQLTAWLMQQHAGLSEGNSK